MGREEDNEPTSDAHDNTTCTLKLVYVHDTLEPKFFEVKPVCLVEVRRNGFWVVIDHNRLIAHVSKPPRAGDSTPVEFNAASDAVDAASQNHCTIVIELDVVL